MMIVFVFDWTMMTMLRTIFCTIIIHYLALLHCNHVSIQIVVIHPSYGCMCVYYCCRRKGSS